MTKERIVFMGTPEFAVASLDALLQAGANIVGVVTAPDRPAGRGMKLQPSAVKEFAVENGLKVLQPTNLKSESFLAELASLQATVQIVVAFRMLPEVVWNMPKNGSFNLHASLLPQYRGAAPINWAVINGEKETGVSTFFLQHQIDTGNIIFQEKLSISDSETAGELHDRLMSLGAELVLRTWKAIEESNYPSIPQRTAGQLKEAPKIFKDHCRIDWNRPAKDIFNLIRGLSPYPTAFTTLSDDTDETMLKIYRAEVAGDSGAAQPGTLKIIGSQLFIACKDAWLNVSEAQLSGKRRMPVSELLRGRDLSHFTAN